MWINYDHYIIIGTLIFIIGMIGLLVRRNILIVLMALELMLNGVNLNFIGFSRKLAGLDGQIFAIFVITIAAAEAVVGLAILVSVFRRRKTFQVDKMTITKW